MNSLKIFFFSLLFAAHALFGQAAVLSADVEKQVKAILAAFEAQDKAAIARFVAYPLHRPYPIPSIKNATEMVSRFDQVFDHKLVAEIRASTVRDWSEVGWRGTMLNQGTLWMTSGKIHVINYSSKFEQTYRKELIERERLSLHPSIQQYTAPDSLFETKQFLIRIDATNSNFRYSSWNIGASQSERPSLVINGGTLDVQGTMRSRTYTFSKGSYTYTVSDYDLVIEQDKKVILEQKILRRVQPFH